MGKKTLYAFILSFVLLIVVIVLNRITFNSMKTFTKDVDHTREVITEFESISNNFKSAQIYTGTYADTLRQLYSLYEKDASQINGELQHLKSLVTDNPIQGRRVDTIEGMINRQMGALMQKNIAEIIQAGESWRLDSLIAIHEIINRGIKDDKQILDNRKAELKRSTILNNALSIAFSIIAIAIIIFTFFSNLFISKKRKWLEGFLETILNSSRNGVVHYKAVREQGKIIDFKIEFLNEAIESLLGISPAQVLGKRLSEFPSYVRETSLMDQYIRVVETGEPTEFENLYKKGNIERWLLVSLVKLDDGLTASFNDISQLKKYEEELKENINNLERSNSELEQYAYVASHDLQEPLRKIRSFGSYLQDTQAKKLDEKGQMQLSKIMSSAERMSVLIKDILSFSSLKKPNAFEMVDLNQILKSVLQDLDLLITQKTATIQSDVLPTIEAIPLQMTQLFYNLLNNSMKFAKEGEPLKITITCKPMQEDNRKNSLLRSGKYFEIVFTDNGIGFSADYEEQIFGLFKRLNEKQVYPGSGIGLSLCRKVVENHHGEIIAKGVENKGASFIIHLPEKQS
jgi:PAS domain S-box-containing protein